MCTKAQKNLFVMNLKTNEIFTVDNWSVSDNVLRVQNNEYLPTELLSCARVHGRLTLGDDSRHPHTPVNF